MGKQAVTFFERSGRPRQELAKVWSLSDPGRQGHLDLERFITAMQYITLAQSGLELNSKVFADERAKAEIGVPAMKGLEDVQPAENNPFADEPEGSAKDFVVKLPQRTGYQMGKQLSEKKKQKALTFTECTSIIDGLKKIYFGKIRPLEQAFEFPSFFSPCLTVGDFDAKPSVLLLGQYSTGKTTFIKHMLKRDYPGTHIGPEPTTDRFVVVFGGHDERRIPGNTLAVQQDLPYQGLSMFGGAFLGRFEGAQCANELLEQVTFIDTPGVLSGEKQQLERSYNFTGVCSWFAYRCDMILLLFDPYKLDISDEFKNVIGTLKGHDDKVRVVLNKSDQVGSQQLMRVYGSLMWSLGKVFRTPEVVRVYIGSFNDKPINTENNPLGEVLFAKEQQDLLDDLYMLPERSCDRKVNEFVKRVRAAKIHCLIVTHLRNSFGMMTMDKKGVQKKLLQNLDQEFQKIQRQEQLPPGDFPDVDRYREILGSFDLWKFPKYDRKQLRIFDQVLRVDVPNLMKEFDNPFG